MTKNQDQPQKAVKFAPEGATHHATAGPYSPILVVDPDKLVVLSGQAAIDPQGRIVGDSIEEQAHYMLENCRKLLSSAGCGMDDVFKATVYMRNIEDWSAFNAIYETYFNEVRPVRTAIQTGLIGGLLVEIEIWAVKS